jgi:hypothetical protein
MVNNEPQNQDPWADPSLQFLERHQQDQITQLSGKVNTLPDEIKQSTDEQVQPLKTEVSQIKIEMATIKEQVQPLETAVEKIKSEMVAIQQQQSEAKKEHLQKWNRAMLVSALALAAVIVLGFLVTGRIIPPITPSLTEKEIESIVDRRIRAIVSTTTGPSLDRSGIYLLYTPDLYANGQDQTSIVVTVIGQDGLPAKGEQVTFQILGNTNDKKGHVAPDVANTDENGQILASYTSGTSEAIVGVQVTWRKQITVARLRLISLPPIPPQSNYVDLDKDGLTDIQEGVLGTSTDNSDTDGDEINDWQEALILHTNPLRSNLRRFTAQSKHQIWLTPTLASTEVLLAKIPTTTIVFDMEEANGIASRVFVDLWVRSNDLKLGQTPNSAIITGTDDSPKFVWIAEDPTALDLLRQGAQTDPSLVAKLLDTANVQILPVAGIGEYVKVRIYGWVKVEDLEPLQNISP